MGIILIIYGCENKKEHEIVNATPSAQVQELMTIASEYEANYQINSALLICNRALQVVDSGGSDIDKAIVYGQIGKIYLYHKGNLLKSEDFLIKQRDLLESDNGYDIKWKINNYLDLSYLYYRKLDLPYGESYGMLAYSLMEEHHVNDSFLLSQILTSIGNINHQMLADAQAIRFFKEAAVYYPLHKEMQDMHHSWVVGLVNYYNNFGPTDSAIFWLSALKIKSNENICDLADYERLYSIYYLLEEDYVNSIRHAEKSIKYYRACKNPDPYNLMHSYVMLSTALQYAGQYDKALVFLDSALIGKFGEDYTIETLRSDIISISTLATKAEILVDKGIYLKDTAKINDALGVYDQLEILIRHFAKFDIEGFLVNKYYNNFYYSKLMELYSFMYKETGNDRWLNNIHETITAYKAQSFSRENVLFKLSKSKTGNDPSFQEFVKNDFALWKSIFEINSLSIADRIKWQKELNYLLREKIRIRGEFEMDHPQIYQKIIHIENISYNDILDYSQKNNTALINYYIGDRYYNDDIIYVLLTVNGKFKFYTFKNDSQLFNDIDSLYQVHRGLLLQEDTLDGFHYRVMSYRVYNRIFESLYNQVRGSNEVVVIPDEKLHHLAFDALIMENPKTESNDLTLLSNSPFLIDSLNISYAYSPNRFIRDDADISIDYKLSALGMGFSSKETVTKRNLEFLPELRSSYLELETIKKHYHGKKARYFTGYDCTKENFFKNASKARLIHLSTHGGYLSDVRNSGMLYMSEKEGVQRLYQHELRFANISPEILVLSACDSGAGELNTEEGMMSIGRIFQAYGTKKVISALWPLTDKASTDLFNTFYSYYASNTETNVALRNAKLKMLHSNTSHSFPGYWASLILYN